MSDTGQIPEAPQARPAAAPPLIHPELPPLGTVDDGGVVCIDRVCLNCGYNLRGLHYAGVCPECAAPITNSLHGNLLCYSEPGYVRRLCNGVRLIAGSMAAVVIAIIVSMVLGFSLAISPTVPSPVHDLISIGAVLAGLTMMAAVVTAYVGAWFVTAPQPGTYITGGQVTARRLVRANLLLAIIACVLSFIVDALSPPMQIMAIFSLVWLLFAVFAVVGAYAYFRYLRSLATRIPQEEQDAKHDLVRSGGSLATMAAVLLGVQALLNAVNVAIHWAPAFSATQVAPVPTTQVSPPITQYGWRIQMCGQSLLSLGMLILFLWAYRYHRHLRTALLRQRDLAEEHWHSGASGPGAPIIVGPQERFS